MRALLWLSAAALMTALVATQATQPQIFKASDTAALSRPKAVGQFALARGPDHQPFNEHQLRQRWSLVYTGYLNCTDSCPTTLTTLNRVLLRLQQAHQYTPRLIFVSMDPQRDSAQRLAEYASHFPIPIVTLTGARSSLSDFAQAFGWIGPGQTSPFNPAVIAHSPSVALVSPDAQITHWFRQPINEQQLLEVLTEVAESAKHNTRSTYYESPTT